MIERLDDYDWAEVFALAGEPSGNNDASIHRAPPLADVDSTPFTREDVADVVWIEDGDNDGPDWLIGGTLKDGRWFFIAAGCDYTGWDCQSGGNAYVATNREDIERFGMGDDDRHRLNVELPESVEEYRTTSAGY